MIELTPAPQLDERALRQGLRKTYARIALFPGRQHHIHTGRKLVEMLGYGDDVIVGIPDAAVEAFCGSANPFVLGGANPGEMVLDVGCGGGMDLLIAARQAGPIGRALGVDFVEEMCRTAEEAARKAKAANVEIRRGEATELPVDDASVDLVIANGVVNQLIPDKVAAMGEIARVLRPGGRLLMADMSVGIPMPGPVREIVDLWCT